MGAVSREHGARLIGHRCSSRPIGDVAAAFDEEVDLLFVNGDHSYEGCRADGSPGFRESKAAGLS